MNCTETKLVELVQGALTPPETRVVLRHLKTCRPCRERVKVMAVLEKISPEKGLQHKRIRLYWMAAGLVLFALIPSIVDLGTQTVWQSNHWARFAETKPHPYFPLDPRSAESSDSKRRQAFLAYNRQDYRSALSELSRIEVDAQVLFYRGVCEYLLGQDKASLAHLREAARLEAKWKEPSLWYQANLQLRLDDVEEASAILEQLSKPGGEYFTEADSLLTQLKLEITQD